MRMGVNSFRILFILVPVSSAYLWLRVNKIYQLVQLAQMHIDTLELPIDWKKVELHKEANRIGKRLIDPLKLPEDMPGYGPVCEECGRRQTHCPKFKVCEREHQMKDRYGIYGPNCVIYLGFIKRITIFMTVCIIAYAVPMLILNLSGVICRDSSTACNAQDVIYFWSTYNVLGATPGSLPHHILWFVFSLTIIVFLLYLRKYSLKTFRMVNGKNITDSDFSLILRRLPEGTTQEQIIELFQRQVLIQYDSSPKKNSKILEQMKGIKVRNVILVYRFYQMMEVNYENVKNFKEFEKKKTKGKNQEPEFISKQLPQVTQFADAAIVRFYNNRAKDLILRTVKISFWMKFIKYFFPFYSAVTQYKIRDKQISIDKAPQPTDIQWQNFGFSQTLRIVRKILSTLFTTTLLIFSAAISISISIWIESLLANSGIQPTYLTIILVIITLTINIIIQAIVMFSISLIKLDTFTDEHCEQLSASVINESINLGFFSIFAPILAKLPSFIQLNTSSSSSFPLVMFTTIIIQSFFGTTIGFLLEYFAVVNRVIKFLTKKQIIIKTQTEAYATFKGSQVPFVNAYAHMVKIVWFSFLYGVVSPICVAIGTVGIFIYYYYQRILFNSKYSIPIYGHSRINSIMIDLLDFTPFLVGLFNLFLYQTSQNARQFDIDGRVIGIVITNIVVGAVNAVFPWQTVLSKIYNEKQSNSIEEYDPAKLDKTYERCYPASKPEVRAKMKGVAAQVKIGGEQIHTQKVNIKSYVQAAQAAQSNQNLHCDDICFNMCR